jgi:hypothetical protein
MATKWDVFISYVSKEDTAEKHASVPPVWRDGSKTVPEIFKEHLVHLDSGLRCFIDKVELEQGDDWQRELEEALRSCTLLVAFVTPGFATSKWATRELALADDQSIRVMPCAARSPRTSG